MFTGIIQTLGTVISITPDNHGKRLVIYSALDSKHLQPGASVMCNGACMTVTHYDKQLQQFSIDVSPESLDKTTMNHWTIGSIINLEPSLCAGDPLGGHIVTGHVDSVASVTAIIPQGSYHDVIIEVPGEFLPFIAVKGSLAIDGCSLTVASIDGKQIRLAIVPHTWEHTIIHTYHPETKINLEIDILARYVQRALHMT